MLISVVPIAIEYLRARGKSKKEAAAGAARPVDPAVERPQSAADGRRGRHAKR